MLDGGIKCFCIVGAIQKQTNGCKYFAGKYQYYEIWSEVKSKVVNIISLTGLMKKVTLRTKIFLSTTASLLALRAKRKVNSSSFFYFK